MKPIRTFYILLLAGVIGGCAHHNDPLEVSTAQNSFIRMYVYEWEKPYIDPKTETVPKVLMLPPLGIHDPQTKSRFHQLLYSAAQRRFAAPLKIIHSDSAYSPYIADHNLIHSDGELNCSEVTVIGSLMNCTHVICPVIRDLKPYHPQRIDMHIVVVNVATGKVSAELLSVFDAHEQDMVKYFLKHCKNCKTSSECETDLHMKVKSPNAFQACVADLCCTVLSDRLPF